MKLQLKSIFSGIYILKNAICRMLSQGKKIAIWLCNRIILIFQWRYKLYEIINRYIIKWDNLTAFTKNLYVGIIISIVLFNIHDLQLIRLKEDAGMDWMMKIFRGQIPFKKDMPNFVFIDIDDDTYLSWGEPFFTPRDKLLKIIKFAVNGKARVVMIDIDLSHESYNEVNRRSNMLHQHDKKLYDYLYNYSVACKSKTDGKARCPQIILSKSLRIKQGKKKNQTFLEIRPSFLDKPVENSNDVHWAMTLFNIDKDKTIRRWRLWDKVYTENGQIEYIPAMHLLAALFVKQSQKSRMTILKELNMYLKNTDNDNQLFFKDSTGGIRKMGNKLYLGKNTETITISKKPSHTSLRIMYKMPWKLPKGEERPNILQILPAKYCTNKDYIPDADLYDKVVIIGGSYTESRDIYTTPLGDSPGALIVLDATHSLLRYGELRPIAIPKKLIIEIILIVFMSYVFSRFEGFWSMFFAGFFIYACLLPLSFIFFKSGVWLDFTIPLIGIQFRQTSAGFNRPKP